MTYGCALLTGPIGRSLYKTVVLRLTGGGTLGMLAL